MHKPDFTGDWTLNVQASALSPVVAPVVQSGFVRIEHREPTVSVHLSITMDGKPFEVRFERPDVSDMVRREVRARFAAADAADVEILLEATVLPFLDDPARRRERDWVHLAILTEVPTRGSARQPGCVSDT
ncbi:MAG: hypothetical protein M3282_03830 [Gemmatimonadota bacterium]|nr:hypothetical protein [Gemmatimonadota bacterium]